MFDCARNHALLWNRDARAPGEIICRQRIFRAKNVRNAALGHDLAATWTRARSQIDNVVGGADRFFIVLNHDHGIAEIAQSPQGPKQTRIVPLMQADARLVQNVKNPCQAGADLRRQPDALRFPAGKRPALAIEGEIAESNLDEKL